MSDAVPSHSPGEITTPQPGPGSGGWLEAASTLLSTSLGTDEAEPWSLDALSHRQAAEVGLSRLFWDPSCAMLCGIRRKGRGARASEPAALRHAHRSYAFAGGMADSSPVLPTAGCHLSRLAPSGEGLHEEVAEETCVTARKAWRAGYSRSGLRLADVKHQPASRTAVTRCQLVVRGSITCMRTSPPDDVLRARRPALQGVSP